MEEKRGGVVVANAINAQLQNRLASYDKIAALEVQLCYRVRIVGFIWKSKVRMQRLIHFLLTFFVSKVKDGQI